MKHFHEKYRYIYIKGFQWPGKLKNSRVRNWSFQFLSDRLSKNTGRRVKVICSKLAKNFVEAAEERSTNRKMTRKKFVTQTDYNFFISKLTSNWHSALEGQSRSIYERLLFFYKSTDSKFFKNLAITWLKCSLGHKKHNYQPVILYYIQFLTRV